MAGCLGDTLPAAGAEWWTKFMANTAQSTELGFNASVNYSDIRADIPNIVCPTLVITTAGRGLASVEETHAWQEQFRRSELLVPPGNSCHVAATLAAQCAQATLEFINAT